MIFDTHAHYDDEAFDEDREELLGELLGGPICHIADIASTYESCQRVLDLVERYPLMCGAVGIHPSEIEGLDPVRVIDELRGMLQRDRIVAIGEIGLDYHWETPERDLQKEWFIRQLELAAETDTPVVLHSRDAAEDTLEIIRKYGRDLTGVMHCFSYSSEMAEEYVKLGYYIGIGGVVTFKNARKMVECVEAVPMERILIETDCPYLAPVPYRGSRNQSGYLTEVIRKIAEIRNISPAEVEEITYNNALRFYKMKE